MNQPFECHITLPLTEQNLANVFALSHPKWKTSAIARDPVLGDGTFCYLTSHARTQYEMATEMALAVDWLSNIGAHVLRRKIEHVVFDERTL